MPRHSSLLTQVPLQLSLRQGATLALAPLLGPQLRPAALTRPSPPFLRHIRAQHLASTPRATLRVALRPTRPPTATGATATHLGQPIPILSQQQGDPCTDRDMEFHSRTPESTAAPLSLFFLNLSSFAVSPFSLPSLLLSSPCPFSDAPRLKRSLALLCCTISLISVCLCLFLCPSFVDPPTPPTLVSGCCVCV